MLRVTGLSYSLCLLTPSPQCMSLQFSQPKEPYK